METEHNAIAEGTGGMGEMDDLHIEETRWFHGSRVKDYLSPLNRGLLHPLQIDGNPLSCHRLLDLRVVYLYPSHLCQYPAGKDLNGISCLHLARDEGAGNHRSKTLHGKHH